MKTNPTLSSQFWRYLWAFILVALSSCLGNVVDGIIVGNLICADGVSAINLSKPLIQLMFTLSLLLAAGAGMLVAYAIGQKDIRHARQIFTVSMAGSIVCGLVFTAMGQLCPETVTRILCDDPALFDMTNDYTRIVLLGSPVYMLSWGLATMVGVDNSPRLVSLSVIIDNVVNLTLDIVFIQVLGWGIAGSSSATVIGHTVGILVLLRHFLYPTNNLKLTLPPMAGIVPGVRQIISQGAPLAIASICLTLLLYSSNYIVLSTVGVTGIFVFSVCMNLLQVYNLFLSGTVETLQSLGAVQVGEKNTAGFRLVLRKSFVFITAAMVITCLYVWLFPETIAALFGATDSQVISECNHALRIFALSFIPFCYIYTLMIVYKLYGCHRMALFLSFALSLTVIPVLWIIAHTAPTLIWYSYLTAYIIEAIVIFALHKILHIELKID